jgi:hypothetical protein
MAAAGGVSGVALQLLADDSVVVNPLLSHQQPADHALRSVANQASG